jgi:hypothetical protein
VDQFGPKHLQPFLQSFNLVLDVFFDGGNLMQPVTEVNIHSASALLTKFAQPSAVLHCLLSRIVHPHQTGQAQICKNLQRGLGDFGNLPH